MNFKTSWPQICRKFICATGSLKSVGMLQITEDFAREAWDMRGDSPTLIVIIHPPRKVRANQGGEKEKKRKGH